MMANSIVDSILNQVPMQVTSSMAARLGGSESAVLSGLWTSIAATLGGLASRSDDHGFMAQIFNLVTQSNQQSTLGTMITNPASGVEEPQVAEQGSKLASLLFGDQQSKIEQLVGRESGLGAPAGSRLMSLAVPVTAGFLSQQIRDRGLSVSSFASLVSSEGSKIQGLLPAGLGVLLSGFTVPSMSRKATEAAAGKGEGRKIFFILIALVAVALVVWLGSHIWNPSQPAPVAPVETAAPAPGPLGAFITRKLPDGTELNIPRLGIENKLIDFMEDPSKPVDQTTWFDFDRLTFDTGKSTLQASSAEQLQNISAILKAYPKVKVKIGGYTDNTGATQTNLKLSQDRADNVMGEFVKRGIDPSRLEAQGYGEDHPVADNATEEGRAKNRRISLRVVEK